MAKTKTNMRLIALGGAGINVLADIKNDLATLGEDYCNISMYALDTTTKTVDHHPGLKDVFYRLSSKRAAVEEIDGLAGERKDKEAAKDIQKNVREFLDTGLPNTKNDYYVLIASGSGGTGNTAQILLAREMLMKDYNVITVVVGDSSNLLNINNTINTLTSLQSIAKATKTALSVVYYNNTYSGVTTPKTEKGVNDKVFKMLSIINTFISGNVRNIDHQDMINFFKASNYQTFKVNPGIYSIGVAKEKLEDVNTLMCRTIIKEENDNVSINVPLLHNKVGIIPESMKDHYDGYPIYLLLRKNILNEEVKYLKSELEKLESLRTTKYDEFDALDTADEDDDLGIVM